MTALLVGVLAGGAALGVLLVVLGLAPAPDPTPTGAPRDAAPSSSLRRPLDRPLDRLLGRRLPRAARRRRQSLLVVALLSGLVLWLVTGFALAVVLAPVAVLGIPLLLGRPRGAVDVERLDALEQWTRSLSGVLVVGSGLESAITASAASAPLAVREEVGLLAARITARWPTERAVRQFADDVDDATADLVAATLVLGAQRRGDGLAAVLEDLAASVAEEVRTRRAVEADRAKPRTTARIVTGIALAGVVGCFVSGYFDPFLAGAGQVILVALLALFVGCLVWMRAVTAGATTPRFLTAADAVPSPATAPAAAAGGR